MSAIDLSYKNVYIDVHSRNSSGLLATPDGAPFDPNYWLGLGDTGYVRAGTQAWVTSQTILQSTIFLAGTDQWGGKQAYLNTYGRSEINVSVGPDPSKTDIDPAATTYGFLNVQGDTIAHINDGGKLSGATRLSVQLASQDYSQGTEAFTPLATLVHGSDLNIWSASGQTVYPSVENAFVQARSNSSVEVWVDLVGANTFDLSNDIGGNSTMEIGWNNVSAGTNIYLHGGNLQIDNPMFFHGTVDSGAAPLAFNQSPAGDNNILLKGLHAAQTSVGDNVIHFYNAADPEINPIGRMILALSYNGPTPRSITQTDQGVLISDSPNAPGVIIPHNPFG